MRRVVRIVEELIEKLAPVIGMERAKAYWLAYLAADREERAQIEVALQMLVTSRLGLAPGQNTIYLPPPSRALTEGGTFLMGETVCNGRSVGSLRLTGHDINQHTLIAGRSGSGKTTAVFRAIASAHENGIKTLVLDWKNEYRSLVRHHAIGSGLRVFTVGKATVSPLRFNPLIPPPRTSPATHLKHTIDLIQNAYYLGEGVAHVFQLAIDALYRKFRVYDGMAEQYPTFADVAHWLSDYRPKNQRESGWLSSTVRAVGALCFGEMGEIVLTDDPLPMADLLAHNTVIELDVAAADKSFLIQSLLWNAYAFCAHRQESPSLQNLIVLEEAHNILRKTAASAKETVVELLMRQARSRGIGIIVVDQTIALLPSSVLSNIHNLFCLSQPPSGVATKMLGLPRHAEDYPGRLEVGEAIAKLQSRHKEPFLIRFPLEPCKEQFVPDSAIRDHMRTFLTDSGPGRPGIATGSQSQRYLDPEEMASSMTEQGKELLLSIWEHPFNGTVQKYKRIGVSRRQGQDLRRRLIQAGMIKKVSCSVPEGKIVLMEVTKAGRAVLREMGVDTSRYNPREGGAVHRYWAERMAQQYRDRDFSVEKEVRVGDRIIDVVATAPDGSQTGIEIMRKGDTCDVVEFAL